MIDPRLVRVLRKLSTKLEKGNINWVLVGSLGLAIRGARVDPHDIDIMTDERGAYEVQKLLEKFVTIEVAYRVSEGIRSHFGALEIDGVKVEIMGDFQLRGDDGIWETPAIIPKLRQIVRFEGMEIPALALEWARYAYSVLGRVDKVKAIDELSAGYSKS